MRSVLPVLGLLVVGACSSSTGPSARMSPAPRTWDQFELQAPRGRPDAPPVRPDSAGFDPEYGSGEPVFLYPEEKWEPVGRGETGIVIRRGGLARAFMQGVEFMGAEVAVRGSVWPTSAYPVAADDSTVAYATLWVPVQALGEMLGCTSRTAIQVEARMVAVFSTVARDDLQIEPYMDFRGAEGCRAGDAVHDRLRSFGTDMLLFAHSAARLSSPVPMRRP